MAGETIPDDPDDGDPAAARVEAEMGAAVDEALADELKRRRARFVQGIVGLDRAEGVGRGRDQWEDPDGDRGPGADQPDVPEE